MISAISDWDGTGVPEGAEVSWCRDTGFLLNRAGIQRSFRVAALVCARPSRAPFRISGPDAEKLLGDTLTTRVKAELGPARWFALLSPQGKIQAEGLIGWAEEAFWLDIDRAVAPDFFRRMRMYKLRAQVQSLR